MDVGIIYVNELKSLNDSFGIAADNELFVGGDNVNCNLGVVGRNLDDVGLTESYVGYFLVDLDSEVFHIRANDHAETGTLADSKAYPTNGQYESLVAQVFTGEEKYHSYKSIPIQKHHQSWLQMSYTRIDYHNLSKKIAIGTYLKGYYSTRGLAETYQASMMQAGAFTPTMNSIFNYDPAYRAYQYGAIGLIPIYKLNDILQIRGEA